MKDNKIQPENEEKKENISSSESNLKISETTEKNDSNLVDTNVQNIELKEQGTELQPVQTIKDESEIYETKKGNGFVFSSDQMIEREKQRALKRFNERPKNWFLALMKRFSISFLYPFIGAFFYFKQFLFLVVIPETILIIFITTVLAVLAGVAGWWIGYASTFWIPYHEYIWANIGIQTLRIFVSICCLIVVFILFLILLRPIFQVSMERLIDIIEFYLLKGKFVNPAKCCIGIDEDGEERSGCLVCCQLYCTKFTCKLFEIIFKYCFHVIVTNIIIPSLLFVVNSIPLLGNVVYSVLLALVTICNMGYVSFIPMFEKREYKYFTTLIFSFRRFHCLFGLGLGLCLINLIPIINLFIVPIGLVSGTYLFFHLEYGMGGIKSLKKMIKTGAIE